MHSNAICFKWLKNMPQVIFLERWLLWKEEIARPWRSFALEARSGWHIPNYPLWILRVLQPCSFISLHFCRATSRVSLMIGSLVFRQSCDRPRKGNYFISHTKYFSKKKKRRISHLIFQDAIRWKRKGIYGYHLTGNETNFANNDPFLLFLSLEFLLPSSLSYFLILIQSFPFVSSLFPELTYLAFCSLRSLPFDDKNWLCNKFSKGGWL